MKIEITPTPETDAEIKIEMTCACYPNEYVSGDFARKLERERDEARQQNVKLQEITEKLADELCDLHACFRRNLNEFYELKEEAK